MDEHPRALNADLLKIGHRLRDIRKPSSRLTLGDLLDYVEHADPTMAIYKVLNPDWEWDLTNQLLAFQIDFWQMKAWAEGGRRGQKPKPIPRPGVEQKKRYTVRKKSSMAEIDEWMQGRTTSS